MSRPTKEGKNLNIFMDKEIIELLEKYSQEAGMTKTIIVERAVKEYIEKHTKESKD